MQGIQYHSLLDSPGLCYVRAKVFNVFNQVMADCKWLCIFGCPAGLVGCCNHIAALLFALEEFVQLGIQE